MDFIVFTDRSLIHIVLNIRICFCGTSVLQKHAFRVFLLIPGFIVHIY